MQKSKASPLTISSPLLLFHRCSSSFSESVRGRAFSLSIGKPVTPLLYYGIGSFLSNFLDFSWTFFRDVRLRGTSSRNRNGGSQAFLSSTWPYLSPTYLKHWLSPTIGLILWSFPSSSSHPDPSVANRTLSQYVVYPTTRGYIISLGTPCG